ncbi:peptidase inhibitor family I36 protein [Kitasatospora sp. NPDC056327]|uniref:peptidase inhibitor family I36 protein n=1 Tax=Kitasatospora sp. NPDC056327 TaxID=3345785 RepID=UPI0035DC450D
MRKKFALAAAGALLMAVPVAGTASARTATDGGSGAPAVIHPISVSSDSLATVWDNCLHGQACLFSDTNGGGQLWVVPSAGSFKLANYNMDNKTSAFWNRSGGTLSLYDGSGYSGYLVGSGPYGPPVNVPLGVNDKASSLTLY